MTNQNNSLQLSIVIPLFDEEQSITELIQRVKEALLDKYKLELILIDDGSQDGSWQAIQKISEKESFVHGIRLQRNYGKSTALQTGFEHAKGDYVATMDADLQDDPREIPEMLTMLKENNYDLVSGWKKKRHDPLSKTIPSRFFNKVTSMVTGIKLHDFNCGLKVYRREVIKNINLYGELHRYIPFLAQREGFGRIGEKVVKHHPRKYGTTKFGISRFMHGFLDLLTLLFVNTYLQRPMHFFGALGFILLVIGGLVNLYLTIDKLFFGHNIGDRPLLLFGVMMMVLGVQIISVGFLGELIQKGNEEKQKPNIKDTA